MLRAIVEIEGVSHDAGKSKPLEGDPIEDRLSAQPKGFHHAGHEIAGKKTKYGDVGHERTSWEGESMLYYTRREESG